MGAKLRAAAGVGRWLRRTAPTTASSAAVFPPGADLPTLPPVILFLFTLVGLQLLVGAWAARRIRTEDDYLVAGRRLGPGLAAASIFATWFGAESCVAAAGSAYEHGVGWHSTEPFAYGLCLLLMGLLFAARLWRFGITTLPDLFAQRFGASTERLAGALLLPSSLFWAAAQIHAFGDVVAINSDGALTPAHGIAIAAGIAIVYTVCGGLLADVYTDVLQAGILVAGLVALLVCVLLALPELPPGASAATVPCTADDQPASLLDLVEAWAIPILGSIVAQEAISRTLAARSANTARTSALLGGSAYLCVGAIPLTIGLLGPQLAPGLADPEAILPTLSQQHLPGWANYLLAGALIAAILSTVDSCLLVVASLAVRNLAPAGVRARNHLVAARVAVVIAGLLAYALATSDWDVGDLVEQASGFGSAGVLVLVVVATRGRGGSVWAANAALLAGASAWVLGRYVWPDAIPHPYLTSLAAAGLGYGLGEIGGRHRGKPASPPVSSGTP